MIVLVKSTSIKINFNLSQNETRSVTYYQSKRFEKTNYFERNDLCCLSIEEIP